MSRDSKGLQLAYKQGEGVIGNMDVIDIDIGHLTAESGGAETAHLMGGAVPRPYILGMSASLPQS